MLTKEQICLRKDFYATSLYFASKNINWLLKSRNTPNGYETKWSVAITKAVLKKAGKL